MANSHNTPKTFHAVVTHGVSEGWGSANYGVSPAPGLSTGAAFRFREDAQKCADELNARHKGERISDDAVFDAIFWDYFDSTPVSGSPRQRFSVWTDGMGISIRGYENGQEISLSDTAAKHIMDQLARVIDVNEVKGGDKQ